MKKRTIFALSAAVAALMTGHVAADAQSRPVSRTWLDSSKSPDERARAAIAAMTLDEKLAMLSGTFGFSVLATRPEEKRIGAGHVPGVPRLGIPDLWESDASLGVANGGEMRKGDVATALPSGLAIAATFDPALAHEGGVMIGSEARAKGFNVLLAGGMNLVRDPWGGRAFEYLGEDPLVSGLLGGEAVRGVQSNGIVSTVKHYALNPQESGRYVVDGQIPEAALRESDLLAFEIAMKIGQPGSVMCGYNKVNGDWACENPYLLTDVLKKDWGFKGWVMSDWGAVHSTEKAALAGLDQQSGRELDKQHYFGPPLKAAVEAGRVPISVINDKVHRILRTMFHHGVVDNPPPSTPQPIDYAAHAEVAQRVAEAGIVLLKNEGNLLPLTASARKIAVIGGHSDVGVLSGGGSSQVRSVGGNALELKRDGAGPFSGMMARSFHNSSPLRAIRERASGATVSFSSGEDAVAAAKAAGDADVAIIFATEWRTEVLDQESLNLTPDQEKLIAAVAAANKRTIVVLETGGPVIMPWLPKVGAVLEAWYPGQRGGEAIARVLFGDIDPSGRLPVTFPASVEQAPRPQIPGFAEAKAAFEKLAQSPPTDLTSLDLSGGMKSFPVRYEEGADVGYRWYARKGFKPAFPFGHGLSYTRFSFEGLTVQNGTAPTARFTVANIGKRAGIEVAQVYAKPEGGLPRLVGFSRISLEPGEKREVIVPLNLLPAQSFDSGTKRWLPLTGALQISAGRSSADLPLSASYKP